MENFNASEAFQLDELLSKYSPILSEIRKRIFFTALVFVSATIIGFIYYEQIIKLLIDILSLKGVNIVFTSPFQFINLAISCGIASGLVIVFPLIIYQVLTFLKPALKNKEFKAMAGFLPFSILLFLAGFSFGVLVMKWQIELFLTKSVSLGIGNILDISRLISTVLMVSVIMGIAFQFPIIMLLLSTLGIVKYNIIARQRLWVYLSALIFIFLLPLDSLLADAMFVLPLIVLFELTLLLSFLMDKRKKRNP